MNPNIEDIRNFIKWIVAKRDETYRKQVKDKKYRDKFFELKDMVRDIKDVIKSVGSLHELAEYNFMNKKINVLIKKYINDNNITQQVVVVKEENDENEHNEDPELTFKKMRKYTEMVINGYNPSLIICGAPGVGKTYRVKKALRENGYVEDRNLRTIKGRCAARVLYSTLYEYQDKGDIVLIDDADGLIGPHAPEDCINILKAALDSDVDEDGGRLVTYGVSGRILDSDGQEIPKRFNFKGSVIVLTNWNASSLDSAVKGRSFIQDINFSNAQMLGVIKKLMPAIDNEHLSIKSKFKALEYLQEIDKAGKDMEISIRTFAICAKMFEAVKNDPDFTDATIKKMIDEQMKLQASRRRGKAPQKY